MSPRTWYAFENHYNWPLGGTVRFDSKSKGKNLHLQLNFGTKALFFDPLKI